MTSQIQKMSNPDLSLDEQRPRAEIAARQAERLDALLDEVYGRNPFYTRKLDAASVKPSELRLPDELTRLPLTTKTELQADQDAQPPWGSNLTYPPARYTRFHQTSSTTGRPLRWLDTPESWQWMLECWKAVFRAARVSTEDRILFPFSFGPFLGFWTAFDAAGQLGALCIPAGGMTSLARLHLIESTGATVICCTPTYALRLSEVAAAERIDLAQSSVRVLIVAGEPGGSIPATRECIEAAWGARVIDHHGLTEVGPLSYESWEAPGALLLNENEYICEVLDPAGETPVSSGQIGELVVTNLGRVGSPLIRYRTGDLVRLCADPSPCGRTFARLDGGILARADQMIPVRGANVYPGAIEAVVRRFPEVLEYRATVTAPRPLRELQLEIELADGAADTVERLTEALRESLSLNVPISIAARGSLPRFEMKARRFIVEDSGS